MEARSVDAIPQGREWQYEPKWDGFRCLLSRDANKVTRLSIHSVIAYPNFNVILDWQYLANLKDYFEEYAFFGNHDRIYYGTDTRAFGLLIGASLSIAFALLRGAEAGGRAQLAATARRVAGPTALVAMAATFAAMVIANGATSWMYPYGMLGLDAAVAILIVAAVARPGCVAA